VNLGNAARATLALIGINVIVFLVMVLSGVSLFSPTVDDLLRWGANARPVTLAGEWWRMLTSGFVHIGVLHLLMNMYALLQVGLQLEPAIGWKKLAGGYVLTAIMASTTSIWLHEAVASAGASGAIFGLYGIFFAMTTTNLVEKSAQKSLLKSIAVFIIFNLAYGMKEGIDNAAHIGGLLSGAVLGYAYHPGLKYLEAIRRHTSAAIASFLFLAIVFYTYHSLRPAPTVESEYNKRMVEFATLESKARAAHLSIGQTESMPDDSLILLLKEQGIGSWEKAFEVVVHADTLPIPDLVHRRNEELIRYCSLNIEMMQLIIKAIGENSERYNEQIILRRTQIESTLVDLQRIDAMSSP
jgi:rhomboid protease GluP